MRFEIHLIWYLCPGYNLWLKEMHGSCFGFRKGDLVCGAINLLYTSFTAHCRIFWPSMIFEQEIKMAKSSEYKERLTGNLSFSVMSLKARLNNVRLMTKPCSTPFGGFSSPSKKHLQKSNHQFGDLSDNTWSRKAHHSWQKWFCSLCWIRNDPRSLSLSNSELV